MTCITRLAVLGLLLSGLAFSQGSDQPLRLMIETDLGGDPDDEQSMVRFLLYANEWDVEGIIANRPHARNGENRNPERSGLGIALRLIDAYAVCFTNLVKHHPGYPSADYLRARTFAGYDDRVDAVEQLIAAVDRPDPRPLWYSDWGSDRGAATNNLRRALDRVLKDRGPGGYSAFKSKLRLASADAFGFHTYDQKPAFPLWVDTFRPELQGKRWYHRFSALTAKAGGFDAHKDLLSGHGPLGALYPTNTSPWLKEGDSMTFLYLVPTGMNRPDKPAWGSWAGRYGRKDADAPYFWANQADTWNGTTNRDNTLARWAVALQNDFRARLDWCVQPRDKANHPPKVHLAPFPAEVQPGEVVVLDASRSQDPDGDELRFRWECYPEASGFTGSIELPPSESGTLRFQAPNAPGQELHLILSVMDDGEPPLTRYARAVLRIK